MNAKSSKREANRVLVIACGMIAREVLAVKERHGLDHVDLTCLPAGHHFEPQKIAPDMERAIEKARAEGYAHIFAGFADCGTGGMLDRVLERHGVERIAGPHCFAFYQGLAAFEALGDDDMTTFYMTDFLCRNFETFFIRPLGLDRHPELVSDYFGHYTRLVYLQQEDDPALEPVARNAAAMLGLAYERRFTGYGDLETALAMRSS